MAANLSQVFWEAAIQGVGSNILVFGLAVVFFVMLFFITRQSLSSSLIIGVIAIEGLVKVANEPFIDLLGLTLRVLIVGVIGFVLASAVFKK